MVTPTIVIERETPLAAKARPVATSAFTWMAMIFTGGIVAGLYLDGWAHNHRQLDIALLAPSNLSQAYAPPGFPSTITTWHALYYAGLLILTGFLSAALIRNHAKGYSWARALPAGYNAALVGILLVIFGGLGELIWPASLRGYPPDILGSVALTVVLSPVRLLEIVGLVLVVIAPLGAFWTSTEATLRPAFTERLSLLLSLAFLLSVLTYVTQFAHPLVDPWAALSYHRRSLQAYRYGQFIFGESLGVLGILLQTALMMGVVLLAVRRWALPHGSLTLLFTLNALLMAFMQDYYAFVLAAGAAGVVADVLLRRLKTAGTGPLEFRLFAFIVPVVYYASYFLALGRMQAIEPSWGTALPILSRLGRPVEGLGWPFQLVIGAVLAAGIVGWMLSLLAMPPTTPPGAGGNVSTS